jgi:hypothetical protein
MPSVASTGTHLLYMGVRHRLIGVERAHSLIAVLPKIPVHGRSFARERATVWAIISGRVTKMRGLLLDRRFLTSPRSKEGAVGKVPVVAAGVELVRNVDCSTAVLVATGGAAVDGE